MLRKPVRKVGDFNAASMADVTFLLLIFFIVTTTISSDKGIKFVLPPKVDNTEGVKVKGVVNVFLNDDNEVLLGKKGKEEVVSIEQVSSRLRALDREIAANGDSIIVSIKVTDGSLYKNYLAIIDQIKSAKIDRISLAQE
ncbi:MAG TPA: biopolymer transporter ExbD [Clostridiales bacterium]|jgi:biopolymer transport protein ExbD|nr:biopolymer transporter ExbD [Clostridiales bacterium]HQP70165.1 biopolymer transporter ExbD [Clostridiales bacterium]